MLGCASHIWALRLVGFEPTISTVRSIVPDALTAELQAHKKGHPSPGGRSVPAVNPTKEAAEREFCCTVGFIAKV